MEFGLGLAKRSVVLTGGAVEREDLVAKLKDDPPGTIKAALDRGRPSWESIRASLARCESRSWRCKDCNTINPYPPDGGAKTSSKPVTTNPPVVAEKHTSNKQIVQPARSGPESTSILDAVEEGNLNDVKHWISQNPKCVSVREKDYLSATALHIAAKKGSKEIAEVLLIHGAEVNAKDGNGWTALHFAAEAGYKPVVELLLNKGAINCENKQCSTPSQLATRAGHKEVAELIANSAQVKPKESVHAAAERGDLKTVRELINDDPELVFAVDEDRMTPLHKAKSEEVADFLLSKGADHSAKDKRSCTPLPIAAMHGHADIVALLLSKGSNVHASGEGGWTPLKFAAYFNREDVMQLLRQRGGHE
jgi:ankyrin repeat protein